jgi:hypothetical protein
MSTLYGGETMHTAHEISVAYTGEEAVAEAPLVRTKFNISMEKKIEKLWLDSDRQGWSYSRFVSTVMEVLTVLHHRNKLVRKAPVRKSAPHKNRALV